MREIVFTYQKNVRILKKFHDSSTTKHFEKNKTLTSLKKRFYWSHMRKLIENYVKTCDIYMKTKLFKRFSHEKLLSLSTSNKVWFNITVNFVTNFSKFSFYKSFDIFDCIMITMNRFIKMTHYLFWVKTMNFKQFTYLLIRNVINFHNLFKRIINDKETLFTSHF